MEKTTNNYKDITPLTLSPREHECLSLWAQGYTIKRIALNLGLSPRTVETHVNKVKSKTGLVHKDSLIEFFHLSINTPQGHSK